MKALEPFKERDIPLTGATNNLSTLDSLRAGEFVLVKNFQVASSGDLQRADGFTRLLSEAEVYNNQDLHDQFIGQPLLTQNLSYFYTQETNSEFVEGAYGDYSGYVVSSTTTSGPFTLEGQVREAITLLYDFESPTGLRRLVAATKSRIYTLSEPSGQWRMIADGKGGPPGLTFSTRRFRAAAMANHIVLTNDFDRPLYWQFDAGPEMPDLQSAREIDDLVRLRVTKARFAVEFKGFMFLGNIEEDGIRQSARVLWSDFTNPLSYYPSDESLSDSRDVGDLGEQIIGMLPMGDFLMIYKERSIWRCVLTGEADSMFNFTQVYRGSDTPKHVNSIVSTGDTHFWMGDDAIYHITIADTRPQRVPWMHNASALIFRQTRPISSESLIGGIWAPVPAVRGIDRSQVAVGGYDPNTKELFFSWKSSSDAGDSPTKPSSVSYAPNRTMVFNLETGSTYYLDHGFTAFGNMYPSTTPSLVDFLLEYGICEADEIPLTEKEGSISVNEADGSYPYLWNLTEDPDGEMGGDGLCAALGDLTIDDLCGLDPQGQRFVMSSSTDLCIKQRGVNYWQRDIYEIQNGQLVITEAGEQPVLIAYGYESILETGALRFEKDAAKQLMSLTLEYGDTDDDTPVTAFTKFGFSNEPQPRCFRWVRLGETTGFDTTGDTSNVFVLNCQQADPAVTDGRPDNRVKFSYLVRGTYLGFQIKLLGNGPATLTRATIRGRMAEERSNG